MTQKLKPYNTEAEIPTELKPYYAQRGDKWEPQFEGVDSISGVLAKNTELLGKVSGHATEIAGKDAEIQRLSGQLANASNSTIPRGHEAVPKADADLARAVKASGVETADAFKTLHTEHGSYKAKAETADKLAHAEAVGEAMGWDKAKTSLLVSDVFDLSTVELRDGADGKKQAVAKVKQADNTFVEKPFADVVGATPKLSALLPLLTGSPETVRVPGGTSGKTGAPPNEDIIDKSRREREEARKNNPNPLMPPKPATATASA